MSIIIKREQYDLLLERLQEERKYLQVVTGARQIGKTTMILQVLKDCGIPYVSVSADAQNASVGIWLSQQWESARLKLKNENIDQLILFVDEIQKLENWSEAVKKMWDEDTINKTNIKVVLSGSSKLLLSEGLSESLTGRFEVIKMMHWNFQEMQAAFDFTPEQYVYFGAYPGAASFVGDEKRWRDYISNSIIETTISKDILMLHRIDKPALLKQLFELGSHFSTLQVSYNKLLGQLQNAGNATTLVGYLNLLSDAHLLSGLPKYSGSIVKQKNSTPKFQVYNNAFLTVYSEGSFEQVKNDSTEWGKRVESAIGAHLLNQGMLNNFKTYYWRASNDEVDFILKKDSRTIALEVKSGSTLKSAGLEKAHKIFNFDKLLMTGTEGLHWKDFLKINTLF